MKKRSLAAICLVLSLVVSFLALVNVSAGTENDPLISLSYLEDIVLPSFKDEILYDIEDMVTELVNDTVDEKLENLDFDPSYNDDGDDRNRGDDDKYYNDGDYYYDDPEDDRGNRRDEDEDEEYNGLTDMLGQTTGTGTGFGNGDEVIGQNGADGFDEPTDEDTYTDPDENTENTDNSEGSENTDNTDISENAPVNTSYTLIELDYGQTVMATGVCEFIARPGSFVTVISPHETQGIADITGGNELLDGDEVPFNAYCLIPRGNDGRGFRVVSQKAYIMIRGEYTIG